MEKDIQKDDNGHTLKKRFENLAAALYLVTNHLPDREPLKTKARDAIHIVLEECIVVSDMTDRTIINRLDHIRSILKIASMAGLVSAQNVSLLDNEIISIRSVIESRRNSSSSLSINIHDILMFGLESGNPVNEELQAMDQGTVSYSNSARSDFSSVPMQSTGIVPKVPQAPSQPKQLFTPRIQNFVAPKPKKEGISDRQTLILKEIRSKGQLTIRDLIGKIEGCSEKTIQRELLSLVESGILKKEGERRWSKYSVK